MNRAPFLLALLFCLQYLSAQDYIEPQMGDLKQTEIDMEFCSFDTTANAVVLFDIGKAKFIHGYEDFDIWFTRHKRVKIFNEQGFENAEITIPFYVTDSNEEEIESLEAYTYVIEDGKIQKHQLDPGTVYTERINQWWKQKKFVFPNLKEGAIIEYSYVHKSPFVFNLPDWEFQSSIPTLHSQYQVGMIPFYEYVCLSNRVDALDYSNVEKSEKQFSFRGVDYQELVYTYGMKNVEGFKDESYITSKNDYIRKMDFQLAKVYNTSGLSREIIPTWAKLNSDLLAHEDFGRYKKSCRRFANKALEEIDLTNKALAEKTEMLINYVKESFYWNGYYGKYATQSAKNFYNSKSGNSADINLFLLALLEEAGISAEPMLISTRDHGKISMLYPIVNKFNYVLVLVNEPNLSFITDGTSSLLSYTMVPTRCINEHGLIVNKDKEGEWVQNNYSKPSLNYKIIDIQVDDESEICEVSTKIKTDFFEAYKYRSRYKDDSILIKNSLEENFDEVFNIETKNYDSPELPYEISFEAEKELSWINNYLLVEPFFSLSITENMLKQEKRDYPVDMLYPKKYQYDISLNLPQDYEIEKLPDSYFVNDDLVSITFSANMDSENNRVKIVGQYLFKKAVYTPKNYALLKSHLDTIVEKFNIELILKA